MDNYILSYYQQIKNGSIVVGKWILLVYEYLVRGLEEKRFYYDPKKANHAIDWIENHCFHVEGKLAPGNIKLELWQKALLSAIFGIIDLKGNPAHREIVLIVARKNGKSLLASAICRYIWCNFGFGTRVYNIAPKLDQADIIYNTVWTMTTLDPEWQEKERKRKERDAHKRKINEDDPTQERHRMTDLFLPATNSTVKKIAFSSKRMEGFNPSITVLDEIASYPAEQGLKVYESMKSAMGARDDSFLLSISTAGYSTQDGIYDELMKRSTRMLMGDSKETKLLPFLYIIDDVEKWSDIGELRKSNPNLGVSISVDYLLEEIAIAEESLSKRGEFLIKYANVPQTSSIAWLSTQTVEKACGEHLELEQYRNSYCCCGIDLSQVVDLTCVTTVIEKDKELYVFAKFFLPSGKLEEAIARDGIPYQIYVTRGILQLSGDNFVDYRDVYNYMRELVEQYQILPLQVGYDRWSSQYLIQDLQNYGFQCDDVNQGENLSGVINELEGLLKDGKVHIGDNDLLKMHLLNSAMKRNSETNRRKLIKINQNLHVDGTASLLDAMTVRQKHYAEIGERLRNHGIVR